MFLWQDICNRPQIGSEIWRKERRGFFFNDKKNLRLEKNKNFLQKGEKRDRAGRGGGSGVEGGTKVKVVKNSELGCGGKVEGKRTKSIYVCGNWGHKI